MAMATAKITMTMTVAIMTTIDAVNNTAQRSAAPAFAPARSARTQSADFVTPAKSQSTDESLAVSAARGSMPAFVELVDRFESRLFNFLLRRVRCAADAEDLTQDTFVRAWQQIHRYRPGCRFSTWLFTIASRLAIDLHRSRKWRSTEWHGRPARVANEVPGNSDLSDDWGSSTADNIWKLAATVLTDEQHTALWLRYAEDLSNVEIASVLGRTPIGVRVMLHRARTILAGHLNARSTGGPS